MPWMIIVEDPYCLYTSRVTNMRKAMNEKKVVSHLKARKIPFSKIPSLSYYFSVTLDNPYTVCGFYELWNKTKPSMLAEMSSQIYHTLNTIQLPVLCVD